MPEDDYDLYGEDDYRQPQKSEVCNSLCGATSCNSDNSIVRLLDVKASNSKNLRKRLQP
jgi:hypothetical protein